MLDDLSPEVLAFRDDAFLMRFAQTVTPRASGAVQAYVAAVSGCLPDGVVEVAPALASVLVRFDPERVNGHDVAAALQTVLETRDWGAEVAPDPARVWQIPACFEARFAPDLGEVCSLAGLNEIAAVRALVDAPLRVLAIGFAPGQPYLGMMPPAWDFARREALAQVKAGALVAAVRQLVLFANDSPTGWRQVGQTAFRPFQPGAEVSFPLRAGDGVRFEPVSAVEFDALLAGDVMGGARCVAAS